MSLGNDLASIRKEKNLSLEDIFEATKIPVHTLKSIENDTLLQSSSENKTYLRSFVRSYAKALKIPDEFILKCLSSTEAGTYNGDLILLVNPESATGEFSINKDKVEIQPPSDTSQAESYKDEIKNNASVKVAPSAKNAKNAGENINWADMSKRVHAEPNRPKLGLIFVILFFVFLFGAIGYYFSENIAEWFSSSDEQTTEMANSIDSESDDNEEPPLLTNDESTTDDSSDLEPNIVPPTTNISSTLPETLTITLYAAYDKLEPVRVTSDINNRTNPFWMDQGEAYYFDFKDSLRIRGQYSRFLILFNGNVINNPRQNYFDPEEDAVVLTRNILETPEYANQAATSFPENLDIAAPDSIIYKIRF